MILIAAYDAIWPQRFEQEAAAILSAFGSLACRVEHVGSTAVPGLAAKPVIDIQVSVRSLEAMDPLKQLMGALGYSHVTDPDAEFERSYPYFHKPAGWPHSHHVHLCEAGSDTEWRHMAFRDYLRTHAEAREEYLLLKRRLAKCFHDATHEERQRYADAKSEFVARILSLAKR